MEELQRPQEDLERLHPRLQPLERLARLKLPDLGLLRLRQRFLALGFKQRPPQRPEDLEGLAKPLLLRQQRLEGLARSAPLLKLLGQTTLSASRVRPATRIQSAPSAGRLTEGS